MQSLRALASAATQTLDTLVARVRPEAELAPVTLEEAHIQRIAQALHNARMARHTNSNVLNHTDQLLTQLYS